MDKAFEVADKWAQQLTGALTKIGPHAADLALELGRVAAAQHLFLFLFGTILFAVFARFALPNMRTGFERLSHNERCPGGQEQPVAMFMAPGIAQTVIAVIGFVTMMNHAKGVLFAIAGLFNPAIFLAASALNWV